MDLLKHEFTTAPATSYNGMVGTLVKTIKHYRNNEPIENFKAAIPEFKRLEIELQKYDAGIGQAGNREYIQEIISELDVEDQVENKLLEDLERAMDSIFVELHSALVTLEDLMYSFKNSKGVLWLDFDGYVEVDGDENALKTIREIFRSVCSKHNVVFIDSTI